MTVEVLVGMIASGKSTYARERASAGALVVCHDDLCAMLHPGGAGDGKGYEPSLHKMYRTMEHSLVWAALDAGRDVVIDRTHLTRESRERWIKWARETYDSLSTYEGRGPSTRVVAVVFPFDAIKYHASRRFESDPRGRSYEDWFNVACHHHSQMVDEPISDNEGFHEIRYKTGEPIP